MKRKLTINTLAMGNLKQRRKQYTILIIGIILAMVFSSGVMFFISCTKSSNEEYQRRTIGDFYGYYFACEDFVDVEQGVKDGLVESYGYAHILGYAYTDEEKMEKGTPVAWLDEDAKDLYYVHFIEGRYPEAKGEIVKETVNVSADADYVVISCEPDANAEVNLAECDTIVSGGRGLKSQDDLGLLEELAGLVNGEISSSRPLVDNGWLPHSRQIGQSGATVTPKLMFNVGVSGSVQYVLGMQKAGCIVVVNTTPDAPIFDYAHYGIVADYRKFIPALIEEIKARKA